MNLIEKIMARGTIACERSGGETVFMIKPGELAVFNDCVPPAVRAVTYIESLAQAGYGDTTASAPLRAALSRIKGE